MNFTFGYMGSTGVMVMQELCRDSGQKMETTFYPYGIPLTASV